MRSPSTAEDVCRQMAQIRRDFREDVHEIVETAHRYADWKYHVRSHPWVFLGVAAAVGYLIVPPRLEIRSPDYKTLKKLAEKNHLVVEANPQPTARSGFLGSAMSFVGNLLIRQSLALAGQKLGELFAEPQSDSSSPDSSKQRLAS